MQNTLSYFIVCPYTYNITRADGCVQGSGEDFYLKRGEFKYLLKKGEIDFNNAKDIGGGYYSATINFYNSDSDLALSFGRATII